ncbi:MAG: hypothetical protein ABSB35_32285 [Bryobacteraceae bacterium]|jgi:hypothetical protein
MNSLLDQFRPNTTAFRPSTARELFALRLAQKLNDVAAVRHFVNLAEDYSEGQLLCAYRRTIRANGHGDAGWRFHVELKRIHGNGHHDPPEGLVSIRIERRAVAVAIFQGDHLEYTDARQLSSDRDKAIASAVGFISWILSRFAVESAVLESILTGQGIHRRVLHDTICATLRERMLPIWEIPKAVLLEGYGHPPLRSRAELRQVATSIWPILSGTHAKVFIQDAAVLGLHVQTERLFIIN